VILTENQLNAIFGLTNSKTVFIEPPIIWGQTTFIWKTNNFEFQYLSRNRAIPGEADNVC
jgi:hypothetical protein